MMLSRLITFAIWGMNDLVTLWVVTEVNGPRLGLRR